MLGLMARLCRCVTPCGGSTGGGIVGSVLIAPLALLSAEFAALAFALLLATPAFEPCRPCAALAMHG